MSLSDAVGFKLMTDHLCVILCVITLNKLFYIFFINRKLCISYKLCIN